MMVLVPVPVPGLGCGLVPVPPLPLPSPSPLAPVPALVAVVVLVLEPKPISVLLALAPLTPGVGVEEIEIVSIEPEPDPTGIPVRLDESVGWLVCCPKALEVSLPEGLTVPEVTGVMLPVEVVEVISVLLLLLLLPLMGACEIESEIKLGTEELDRLPVGLGVTVSEVEIEFVLEGVSEVFEELLDVVKLDVRLEGGLNVEVLVLDVELVKLEVELALVLDVLELETDVELVDSLVVLVSLVVVTPVEEELEELEADVDVSASGDVVVPAPRDWQYVINHKKSGKESGT